MPFLCEGIVFLLVSSRHQDVVFGCPLPLYLIVFEGVKCLTGFQTNITFIIEHNLPWIKITTSNEHRAHNVIWFWGLMPVSSHQDAGETWMRPECRAHLSWLVLNLLIWSSPLHPPQ